MKLPRELEVVATRLDHDLRARAVFVGGMIRGLLVTDPAVAGARPTRDVDLIVDVASRQAMVRMNERLRGLGFREANEEGAPICRWIVDGVRVDVMPVDPALLGFSNVWYPGGITHATQIHESGIRLRILDAPHFCATKLEAYASRGGGDFYHSDMEDFIAVVDGRPELQSELSRAPTDLREFLADQVASLLGDATFLEAIPGNLAGDGASQARLPLIMNRLHSIAALHAAGPSKTRSVARPIKGTPNIVMPSPSTWQVVRSSNLRAVAFDGETGQLFVEFDDKRVYVYLGVPSTVYGGLMGAASVGRYHHRWIKSRYRCKRLV